MRGLLAVIGLAITVCVTAHESRPAYLEIEPLGDTSYRAFFKQPYTPTVVLRPEFDPSCAITPESSMIVADAVNVHFRLDCQDPLEDSTIRIDGLRGTLSEVLIRYEDGDEDFIAVIHASNPQITIDTETNTGLFSYLRLGITHLLFGWDHLAFLVCLLYIARQFWTLAKIVTAFTVAHSITLILTALIPMQLPIGVIETFIALTVLMLAADRIFSDDQELKTRSIWIVVFVFGLIHGCGFASSLNRIGLPEDDTLLALLLFNVGVEIGQLCVVAVVLALLAVTKPLNQQIPAWTKVAPLYGCAGVASYWVAIRFIPIFA